MKAKLLKKLRKRGRKQITIYSITKENRGFGDVVVGMSIGYNDDKYSGLGNCMSEKEALKEAERIYIEEYLKKVKQ